MSEDTKATLKIIEQMGIDIKFNDTVSITGKGLNGLKEPKKELNEMK